MGVLSMDAEELKILDAERRLQKLPDELRKPLENIREMLQNRRIPGTFLRDAKRAEHLHPKSD